MPDDARGRTVERAGSAVGAQRPDDLMPTGTAEVSHSTGFVRDPLAAIAVSAAPIVLEGRYRPLVGALVRLRRSRRGRWALAAGSGALGIALAFLAARQCATTSWPLSDGQPGVLVAAGLLLLLAQAFKAYGWGRLFTPGERPKPLALAAGNGAPVIGVVERPGRTSRGPTTITGDVGTYPTPTETGFDSVTLIGTNHAGDAVTQQAKADLTIAYVDAAGRTPVSTVSTELGGQTLISGVYDSASGTFGITGTLTLNGQGDPNAVFIFKMKSTLITASSSNVVLINGTQACNERSGLSG